MTLAFAAFVVAPREASAANSVAAAAHPTRAFWLDIHGTPPSTSGNGARQSVHPKRFRAVTLDALSLGSVASSAPREHTQAARSNPVVVSLPDPSGGFQRFTLAESPVMEAGLALKHPEIRTYAGKGIDDPTASLRMDTTPLGLHASVRSAGGAWYIDPYYHLDTSLYASYYARDLQNVHGPLNEATTIEPALSLARGLYHAADTVQLRGAGFAPGATVTISVRNPAVDAMARQLVHATASPEGTIDATLVADPYRTIGSYELRATDGRNTANTTYNVVGDSVSILASTGNQLRTYRLALLTDPSYASYFGAANVTAAKVTLINRVSQVYESETSIRMMLIAGNDALNLNTAAQMTGANGPCGGSACFTATQAASCGNGTLTRTRIVIGLLVGASNYDFGHIALGVDGGGLSSLGVVGGNNKAQGCTGIPTPVGDFFAVDYVAHEMGHEFNGNHTFNGTISNCSTGNRNAATSVEPGSGSSIMAYAGICGTDNLQTHSDPYWSERSFDEITTYTSAAETSINEVQMGVLTGFASASGQQFQLQYGGASSAAIVGGSNYTTAGVKAAIEAIPGWPTGGTVTVTALTDTGFTVTFGGTLAGVNTAPLALVSCSAGCTGFVGEIAKGGATTRNGTVTATGNNPPVVTAPVSYTIPIRTPFVLSGSATDADGDTLTYMWEQNDRGATGTGAGTGLITQPKLNGPLFRQFGTRAIVSATDTLLYDSPGENHTTTDPSRTFPDMAQILANNTNAETGLCPTAQATPTAADIDCYSEYLPTASYVGTANVNASPLSLNFRLTARDGRGGIGSAMTQLLLATGAGPFLVTSPNTAVNWTSGRQTVTWNVANTSAAPVSTANVKITLSTDSGATFPYVLAASTPNTGSASVLLPAVVTRGARIKVEAVGNIFFDVSNADFTIRLLGDANGDGAVSCADVALVRASLGKRTGQAGFDARADLNGDGVVDIRDLATVTQQMPAGSVCN